MGYKKLTNTGIQFIRTICKGTGNSLLKGKHSYALPNSGNPPSTIYTAHPTLNGEPIETNFQLGEVLIQWFNFYANLYSLDANIIAAQAYVESSYRVWAYSTTGAQGVCQFLSGTLYDVAIGGFGVSSQVSIEFTDDEIDRLTLNLTNPKQQNAYTYGASNPILSIAKDNKSPFFQNVIDNPDLIIKAQCRYMAGLGIKAANNAASSLFGYNQGASYVKSTFTSTAKLAESSSGYDEGINYVKRTFTILGSKEEAPSGIWFGYDIDFTFDSFQADVQTSDIDIDNVDRNLQLSPSYVLQDLLKTDQGILNIPTNSEIDNLRSLANAVLQRITNEVINGEKLIVNSSFRNPQLNSIVGGVVTSQHQAAQAADVRVSGNGKDLWTVYKDILASTIPYDQIIYETKGEDIERTWIHISYKREGNRFQQKTATLINRSMRYAIYIAGQDKPIA